MQGQNRKNSPHNCIWTLAQYTTTGADPGAKTNLQDNPDHAPEAEVRDLGFDPLQTELDVTIAGVNDVLKTNTYYFYHCQ